MARAHHTASAPHTRHWHLTTHGVLLLTLLAARFLFAIDRTREYSHFV